MYKSVLIPLDGSESAAKAIPVGVGMARVLGAEVVLLQVLRPERDFEQSVQEPDLQRAETSSDVIGRRDYDSQRSQAQGYLDGLKRSLRTSEVPVETRLEEGDAATMISQVAKTLEQPIIVITPHGKSASLSPTTSGVFGHVADQVLKQSTRPVLVAKS